MKVSSGTIKNTKSIDKPNEDLMLCDVNNDIYILLDGVSRDRVNDRYPHPSPAVEVTEILKDEIHKHILLYNQQGENILENILRAIKYANDKVRGYNEEKRLLFAAGAVGIVVLICNDVLYYAYIGDCYGRLIYENQIEIFTECQTELINKHKKEFTSKTIREEICNNPTHPYAYGVLNGDKRAINFIRTGIVNLTDVEQIILSSDGMEAFLERCSLKMLKEELVSNLLENAVLENNEFQDDRTIIKIEKE